MAKLKARQAIASGTLVKKRATKSRGSGVGSTRGPRKINPGAVKKVPGMEQWNKRAREVKTFKEVQSLMKKWNASKGKGLVNVNKPKPAQKKRSKNKTFTAWDK